MRILTKFPFPLIVGFVAGSLLLSCIAPRTDAAPPAPKPGAVHKLRVMGYGSEGEVQYFVDHRHSTLCYVLYGGGYMGSTTPVSIDCMPAVGSIPNISDDE